MNKKWPWARLPGLLHHPKRHWHQIWEVMWMLSDSMSRKSRFPTEEARQEAVADAAIYAMERLNRFNPCRPGAISYFGLMLMRRQRQIVRKLNLREMRPYVGNECMEDRLMTTRGRNYPVIQGTALRRRVAEALDEYVNEARAAGMKDLRQSESAPLVIHTIESLRQALVGLPKKSNIQRKSQ